MTSAGGVLENMAIVVDEGKIVDIIYRKIMFRYNNTRTSMLNTRKNTMTI